ncbi:MAG: hypothetical protein HFH10_15630 [Dorea sp.]|nr:hypothetical protein [Dorea sp.]
MRIPGACPRQGIRWVALKCCQMQSGHPMGCPKRLSDAARASNGMP